MLKKENKLKAKREFDWVFRQAKPVFTRNINFRVARQKKGSGGKLGSRFGFVISAKTEKSAVRRNALKRILARLAKEYLDQIPADLLVVVVVKSSFLYPYDVAEIASQFKFGMEKAVSMIAGKLVGKYPPEADQPLAGARKL